jgi:hypothetical protein
METLELQLNRIQTRALIVGAVALAACGVGAFQNLGQFYQSYLLGYVFWVGLALGSLALLALHHMVGGGWGFAIQRVLESATRTLPLLAILFIPFFFGMKELYLWADAERVAADKILLHKAAYLNVPSFWLRTTAYFGIWGMLTFFVNKWSVDQDRNANPALVDRLRKLGGPVMLLYVLTITFASIDWVMSLEPHWFSTIFGFIFVIGQVLLTMAFAIVALSRLVAHKPLSDVVQTKHFHDLGNLMMAFVMLWAYISLSQFIIIWSANLPEEITWYMHRLHGGWQWIALAIVVFHFAIPFVLLLSRQTKRRIEILSKVAMAMIVMRFIDLLWIIAPNFHSEKFSIHWLDLAAPIGIGGLWIAVFVWQLKTRALLPINDPRVKAAFHHE